MACKIVAERFVGVYKDGFKLREHADTTSIPDSPKGFHSILFNLKRQYTLQPIDLTASFLSTFRIICSETQ